MTVAERKEREKLRRFNEILDAAERVFLAKGFESATIDDIAAEAEISKGTIYLYFKSKELIFIGIDWRGSIILKDLFQKAVAKEAVGLQKILAIGEAYFEFAQKYPHYFKAMNYTERLNSQLMQTMKNEQIVQDCHAVELEVMQIMVDAITFGINDGSIRSDIDPLKTSILLWATSNGAYQMHFNRADEFQHFENIEPNFLITEFYEFIRHSLSTEDPSQSSPTIKQ